MDVYCKYACSTWQGVGPQVHVEDKKQVLNQPQASSDRIDYLGKRLSKADREMDRMFIEER